MFGAGPDGARQMLSTLQSFAKYVPMEVVRELLHRGEVAQIGGTSESLTILFTDIVGSTKMATDLGDGAWRMRLDEHDRTTRAAVEHHAGRVVKTTGDGVLAEFRHLSEDQPALALERARCFLRGAAPRGCRR